MGIENAFIALAGQLGTVRRTLEELCTSLHDADHAVTEQMRRALRTAQNQSEQAIIAAKAAQRALADLPEIKGVRLGLVQCQEAFNQMQQRIVRVMSYGHMRRLVRLGRQRGKPWPAWTRSIGRRLRDCRQMLFDINESLFACWREVSERGGLASISVRTTTVGQRITVPEARQGAAEGFS